MLMMGKTKSPRSRMRDYRERINKNTDKSRIVHEKDRKRKQAARLREKECGVSSEVKAHRDKLNRERVSRFRAKKKIDFEERQELPAYSSKRSLGKAISRAARSLPSSPRKKRVVIKKLAEREGLVKSSAAPRNVTSQETITKVEEFYCRDDISRQAPGKKDCVTIWKEGGKVKLQKRHLYYTIKETHSLFELEYPERKIGKSKFAELKPPNVLHRAETPKDACLCQYHENITLLCNALHAALPTFPTYSSTFVSNFVCSTESEACMSGNCEECSEKAVTWLGSFQGPELNKDIFWYEWAREEVNGPTHSSRRSEPQDGETSHAPRKKLMKCCRTGTVLEAIETLRSKLPNFMLHVFIKREQSHCFQTKLLSIAHGSAVIQIDFSENYTLQHQGEIQSAYWNQSQLTIFTVCVWMHAEKKSIVFVSDELDHEKNSVCVFIHELLSKLVAKHGITKVDIFSDGPSSQFKNQFVLNYLPIIKKQLNLDYLCWNFFATSHGKGAVDGIGGTVKRNVWMETLSRQAVVSSLQDFCEVAMKKEQKIEVIPVSAEGIKSSASKMELNKFFASSTPVPSIKRMHFVRVLPNGAIKCKEFTNKIEIEETSFESLDLEVESSASESDTDEWYDEQCEKLAPPAKVNLGDFVICQYEGELFPGQVTKVHSEGARVKVLQKCAGGWRWPVHEDEIDYLPKDILRKITFPVPINNRGTFRVEELEKRWEC